MKQWQFFLEQHNQSQLLAINTRDYRLSPGNYRLLAQTDLLNIPVEIRLDYHRFQHKYLRTTNHQGFLIMTPYLTLSTGHLHLRCQADVLAEIEGNWWQKTLNLEILTRAQIEALNQPAPYLELLLEAETLIKTSPTRACLKGTILIENLDYLQANIIYRLYHPKTGARLTQEQENLALPYCFKYDLQLNPTWNTCLILGEIHLEVILAQSTLTATRVFSIIDNPKALSQKWRQLASRVNPSAYPQLKLLDIHSLPPTLPADLEWESGQVLPPRINHSTGKKEINLPGFTNRTHLEQAFNKLEVEKRFWLRLNSLANYQQQK
ncbi:hypothetical protein [Gloeocapsa sp. PCC 73106]|uniref:hypothetical protein n=1 Tax=Gloeocapsa sp. PCC 73106 TaxID=102232 RepID=UPI0002ACBDF1|nr:hypothetical protein [Gloeocapsa sp. PCC 73106]ELR99065.1 hypothetical protein GLO73106DRAFT_00029110 [Gloeocapsa sp. PCC 73106]